MLKNVPKTVTVTIFWDPNPILNSNNDLTNSCATAVCDVSSHGLNGPQSLPTPSTHIHNALYSSFPY